MSIAERVSKREPALYSISVEGKWGFIDASGKIVIEPQFLSVGEFSEGLARVTVPGPTDEDRLFERTASGFIDASGDFVIGPGPPPDFTFPEYRNDYSYGDFHDGLATFRVGDATGLGGYIDRSGKLAILPEFADVNDFSEGLACVSLPRSDGSAFGPTLTGFIDRHGKFVIPADREFVALGFSDGLCVISIQDDDGEWHDSVINSQGKTVVPPSIYSGISDFVGGMSRVVKIAKDRKVGCIDTQGRVVIPIEFDQLWEFDVGHFTTATKGGKHFLVDRSGRSVEIDLGMDFDISRLRSGMAVVKSQNKHGYVNAKGELAISIQFDLAQDFRGELAYVEKDGFKGYINRQGEFVWKTDRWDEPIRNAVTQPLSDFLPPNTVASMPLEYNWQGCKNAIVFASNEPFGSLRNWFVKSFDGRFELLDQNDEPGQIDISFFGDEFSGSFHAADVNSESVQGFIDFYASKNMKLLKDRHRPAIVGILILNR